MYDTDDRNDPHNPFRRPPAWRWLRACHLVEDNKRPVRGRDDDKVREAYRFCRGLRHCQDDRTQATLAQKMPYISRAWHLYQGSSFRRWEIEARFLAGEDTRAIAYKCQLPEPVVDAYHDVYYCVRNRLQARDWVFNHVIRPPRHRALTEADQDVLLKLYALHGGPLVLDAVVAYLQDPVIVVPPLDQLDAAGLADLHRRLSIRASVLARTLPISSANFLGLMTLQARFAQKSACKTTVSLACADQLVSDKDLSALLAALPAEPEQLLDQQTAGRNGAAA